MQAEQGGASSASFKNFILAVFALKAHAGALSGRGTSKEACVMFRTKSFSGLGLAALGLALISSAALAQPNGYNDGANAPPAQLNDQNAPPPPGPQSQAPQSQAQAQ